MRYNERSTRNAPVCAVRADIPHRSKQDIYRELPMFPGTAVAQWLRCCVTNRKVAGSIPAGVTGFFIDIKSFRSHYGPGSTQPHPLTE